ncbi:MAG: tRNA pseudouridine(38-40) synthase TruA, partial [Olleya sp.]
FHGWQKQPDVKTVHLMIDRTLKYILQDIRFKTLGAGRTDAMVSANEAALELFIYNEPIQDFDAFLDLFNHNLPQDIRATGIREVDAKFNIIQHSKVKEYNYIFGYGDKFHPFCAPILTTILDPLDIELMKKAARLFEGEHFLKHYCYRPTDNGIYNRTILKCEIVENTIYTANFFPEQSYILRVKGKGFMRNQIRLMMGALIEIGQGKRTLADIEASLKPDFEGHNHYIAPASGLILKDIEFE